MKRPRLFLPGGVLSVVPNVPRTPVIRRGRLYFSCPACNHPTQLYASVAGQDTRCPSCLSAIRAPHPAKRIKARNREQDIESLIRPESFIVNAPPPDAGLLPRVPLPGALSVVKVLGIASLALVVYKVVGLSLSDFKEGEIGARGRGQGKSVAPMTGRPYAGAAVLQQRAEATVRSFLSADGWDDKARFVRNGERVAGSLRNYYASRPEEATAGYASITSKAPTYGIVGDTEHLVTEVIVQWQNYEVSTFQVEHLEDGDLIEWEVSVGYNPVDWRDLVEVNPGEGVRQVFRVLAIPDSYYNYDFDASRYACLRLHDPSDNSLIAYGYIDKSTGDAKELDFLLKTPPSQLEKARERILVEVEFPAQWSERRQVEVVRFVQPGWRMEGRIASVVK